MIKKEYATELRDERINTFGSIVQSENQPIENIASPKQPHGRASTDMPLRLRQPDPSGGRSYSQFAGLLGSGNGALMAASLRSAGKMREPCLKLDPRPLISDISARMSGLRMGLSMKSANGAELRRQRCRARQHRPRREPDTISPRRNGPASSPALLT
jgi:hypothetical protein